MSELVLTDILDMLAHTAQTLKQVNGFTVHTAELGRMADKLKEYDGDALTAEAARLVGRWLVAFTDTLKKEKKHNQIIETDDPDRFAQRQASLEEALAAVVELYGLFRPWRDAGIAEGAACAAWFKGLACEFGIGEELDMAGAAKLYEMAAEQGNAEAQNRLGECFYRGDGVEQDYEKAVQWYAKAAEQGLPEGENNLGGVYYLGKGVEKDYIKAIEWYEKAAAQDNSNSQFNLGWIYENGDGLEEDAEKAAQWYEKAAAQGSLLAMRQLVRLKGAGGNHKAKAEYLYAKASRLGDAQAAQDLWELSQNISALNEKAKKNGRGCGCILFVILILIFFFRKFIM